MMVARWLILCAIALLVAGCNSQAPVGSTNDHESTSVDYMDGDSDAAEAAYEKQMAQDEEAGGDDANGDDADSDDSDAEKESESDKGDAEEQ